VSTLDEVLGVADFVLIMSVNPGFGGQQFIPNSLKKVRQLTAHKKERGLQFPIEIDGGLSAENVGSAIQAGVEWVVAGSSVFHTVNPAAAFEHMQHIAREASAVRV
jgi:ribulose-phosphate 3-epimerase